MTEKIGIVGSGVIGQGWMILFAKAGYGVHVFDSMPGAVDAALDQVHTSLVNLEKLDYVADAEAVYSRMQKCASLEDAVSDTCYVQESVTEDADVKHEVFTELDKYAPADIPLASSCSAIPPRAFLEKIASRERCIVAHPASPPHLVRMVEVVTTPWNSRSFVDHVCFLLEKIGQSPVVIDKAVPGYVANRLQSALVNEAMYLVDEGVISPADLDRCMKNGLGMRWAFMGPFETMELNAPKGFLDYATKFGPAYQALGAELQLGRPWRQETLAKIENWRRTESTIEELSSRRAWRDRMLLRVRALVESGEKEL